MAAQQPLDAALVLGLELVVELLADPLAQLGGERLRVQTRREPLDERQQHRRVAQVRLDRLGDPRVLDLHGDLVAIERRGAVDLTDRGGGERTLFEVGETRARAAAELLAHQLLEPGERTGGTSSRSAASLRCSSSRCVLGKAVELDHREHLTDLHRRAAHPAELVDELPDQRRGALFLGRRRPLGRADPVGGSHPGPAQALPRHQPADPRRPGESAFRQPSRLSE